MFHLFIILAYTIPVIYIFFRIKAIFISNGYMLKYTFVYLIIATIYPVTERLSYGYMNFFMQVLSNISGYTLPFFLYMFLFVLLFDLFLLLNLIVRILPSETRKRFSFRFYALTTMIVLSIAVVVAGAINLNTITVSKYQVEAPREQSSINHLRIAFVADLHIQKNTRARFIEQFVSKVNALQPDIMLYGGDMVEGHRVDETTETIELLMKTIRTKYGAFGVLGNHEFYGRQEQGNFFKKAGITLLCDTVFKIDNFFYLAGRYDQHFRQRKTLGEILGSNFHDLPLILMDHRPTELKEVSKSEVDVQFSGHTHNGQMFPINLITRSVYELIWGYKRIRNTHFFVTSGLRLWGPPVKTAGKSEIVLVDINFN